MANFTSKTGHRRRVYRRPRLTKPRYWFVLKRLLDIAISTLLLFAVFPTLMMAALSVLLITRKSPFLYVKKIGRGGRSFRMIKLSTMREYNDPKIKALRNILERSSVDTLPILINVLRGDMSMVGPSPLSPTEFNSLRNLAIKRLEFRPGITGTFIFLRSGISTEEILLVDNAYVENWSPYTDLLVVARTFWFGLPKLGIAFKLIPIIFAILVSSPPPWDQRSTRTNTTSEYRLGSEKTAIDEINLVSREKLPIAYAVKAAASPDVRRPPDAKRRPRRRQTRLIYWSAEGALAIAIAVVSSELVMKQAFVSGTMVAVLLVASLTLFTTGRFLRSI